MTNSLKAAVCALLLAGSVCTGFANENSFFDQAKELAGQAGDGLKQAGNVILEKGADVTGYVQDKAFDVYSKASDKASDAFKAASDKAGQSYTLASDKAAIAYQAASDKAVLAYNWAEDKAPESVKAFITNHPYITVAAIVAPLALMIGYKLGKSKPVKQDNNDK